MGNNAPGMGNNAPGMGNNAPRMGNNAPGMGNNGPAPSRDLPAVRYSIDTVSVADPGCSSRIRILIFTHPGSRGLKRHRIQIQIRNTVSYTEPGGSHLITDSDPAYTFLWPLKKICCQKGIGSRIINQTLTDFRFSTCVKLGQDPDLDLDRH
jgi:hypothetical protein